MFKISDKLQPRINCKSQIDAGSTKARLNGSDAAAFNGETLTVRYWIYNLSAPCQRGEIADDLVYIKVQLTEHQNSVMESR